MRNKIPQTSQCSSFFCVRKASSSGLSLIADVDFRIGAGLVGAEADQFGHVVIGRHRRARLGDDALFLGAVAAGHGA